MADVLTLELTGWTGMDNTPDITEADPRTVRDCENVDFDEEGMIIKRRGTQAITLTDS
jgi:hypothetical protein